jgi:hypothetical protein
MCLVMVMSVAGSPPPTWSRTVGIECLDLTARCPISTRARRLVNPPVLAASAGCLVDGARRILPASSSHLPPSAVPLVSDFRFRGFALYPRRAAGGYPLAGSRVHDCTRPAFTV